MNNLGNDGYPQYKRRSIEDGGFSTHLLKKSKEIVIDNRWVVPYSPILSKAFQAHINVEFCSSIKSIKYICKYIYKGSDLAMFGVTNDNMDIDEIKLYQLGRYISSNEAIWKIYGFNIHERYPAVIHLSVHLENGQRIYYTEENAKEKANNPQNSTLMAFFELCQTDVFARTLFYNEVPSYYVWNKSKKMFTRRKKGTILRDQPGIRKSDAIGRIYTVHPNNFECYYLRMLLHNIRGPQNFDELKTVNGKLFSTFREACIELGLLENDNQWDIALSEAELICTANQIRNLFCLIITTCNPSDPLGM